MILFLCGCSQPAQEEGLSWKNAVYEKSDSMYVLKDIPCNTEVTMNLYAPDQNMEQAPAVILANPDSDPVPFVKAGMVVIIPKIRLTCPLGTADLKSCIRFLRAHREELQIETENLSLCGSGIYGTIAASAAVSGNDETYDSYLQDSETQMQDAEGNSLSDAVKNVYIDNGCFESSFADNAYEWMSGQFETEYRSPDSEARMMSETLADEYAAYISSSEFKDGSLYTVNRNEGPYTEALCAFLQEADSSITSIEEYAKTYMPAENAVPVFDTGSSLVSKLYGDLRFNATIHAVYAANGDTVPAEQWEEDLYSKDEHGLTLITRENLYEPLYYLRVRDDTQRAEHWHIKVSLKDRITVPCSDFNLILALEENRIDVTSSVQKEMTTWEEDASAWLSNIH